MKINTDPMNMNALDFDGDMWDPEYCDSELRAVEASGESWDELCLYRQTQLKLNRMLTGVDREPRTVIHVKRAKMFDPMG